MNCGVKTGFKPLFKALRDGCDKTLVELTVKDNISLNRAVDELCDILLYNKSLEVLDISDLNLKKKNCQKLADAITKSLQKGSNLRTIIWNSDLVCSK